MSKEKTRVDFNAPTSLVERADTIASLLDISRTQLLIDALQDEIDELAADDQFQQRLREAYYTDSVEFEVVESILGTEEAMRMKLLQSSLDRDPPEPELDGTLPTDAEFYNDEKPVWEPVDEQDEAGIEQTDG